MRPFSRLSRRGLLRGWQDEVFRHQAVVCAIPALISIAPLCCGHGGKLKTTLRRAVVTVGASGLVKVNDWTVLKRKLRPPAV